MKKLITFILVVFTYFASYAQNNDIGLFTGTSYYNGDLNPCRQFKNISLAYGAFYRHNFTNRIALRAGFTSSNLKSDDIQKRGYYFKTKLNEVSTQLEINFYEFGIDGEDNRISPYIFGGIGKSWYTVKEFTTSTTGLPTNVSITNFPLGLGIKYNPIENISVGLEWGLRKTSGTHADQIDDVNEPGCKSFESQ